MAVRTNFFSIDNNFNNTSKNSIFNEKRGKQTSVMGAAGAHMIQGYQSMNSSKNNVSFIALLNELEEEINETRKELNYFKKEVAILNTEKDTVAEMARTKCDDIDKYLYKEIHYFEELINKSQLKQKAENYRFHHQC